MKILAISVNRGSGTLKEVRALAGAGVEIEWALGDAPCVSYEEDLIPGTYSLFRNYIELEPILRAFTGDLIVVHAQPVDPVLQAHAIRPDLPVIFAWRDICGFTARKAVILEQYAADRADALMFYSETDRQVAEEMYELGDKPRAVNLHYCNGRDYPPDLPEETDGIVYEGNISIDHECRDYRAIAKQITGLGLDFNIYPSEVSARYAPFYVETGANMHATEPHRKMLESLTHYDWAFVGGPSRSLQWAVASTNKVFDAIAAGVPIIAYKASMTEDFVKTHNVGVVVEDLREIPDIYHMHTDIRRRLKDQRWQFTMEGHIGDVVRFYEEVIQWNQKKEPKSSKQRKIAPQRRAQMPSLQLTPPL